jgi:plastocyanin
MRLSYIARLFALLLTVGLVAGACSKSTSTSSGETSGGETSGTITIGSDQATDKGSKSVAGMDEFELELDNFYFEPTILKGSPGQELKLELANESNTTHNFTLEAQNIDEDVQAEQKADVTVKFPDSGFVEFFCKFHRQSGMVGELST